MAVMRRYSRKTTSAQVAIATKVAGITSTLALRACRSAAQPRCSVCASNDALQPGPEVSRIVRQPDAAGGNRQRRAERELPDEEKRQQPPQRLRARRFLSGSDTSRRRRAWPRPTRPTPVRRRVRTPRRQSSPAWPAGRRPQLMISGMVMNGPTPIMSIMFSVVALRQADAADQLRLLRRTTWAHVPRSADSRRDESRRARRRATAGRRRIRCRCSSPCRTAPPAGRPFAAADRDRSTPAAACSARPTGP